MATRKRSSKSPWNHLDYALVHLDGARWAADHVSSGLRDRPMLLTGPGWNLPFKNGSSLTNPLVEAGLIYCRKMLTFMGVRLDGRGRRLRAVRQLGTQNPEVRKDDVSIVQLGLPVVTVDQFLSAPTGTRVEIRNATRRVLRSTDKGVAHFTKDRGARLLAGDVRVCANAIIWCLEEYAYRARGEPVPKHVWTR